jgi:membrane-bound metal-dependent hydrolase YbcI (DUF457 family)
MFPRGHSGIAMLFCVPLIILFESNVPLMIMTICAIWFSVFPDFDLILHHKTSTFNHRGFTHSIWFIIIFNVFLFSIFTLLNSWLDTFISNYLFATIGINIGIITHILSDIFNEEGVRILRIPRIYKGPKIRIFRVESDSSFWNNFLFTSGASLSLVTFILYL